MKSVILLVILVGVGSALLGSILFQITSLGSNSTWNAELEQKCEEIAREGFKVQIKYSEINFDKMPQEDVTKIKYLDNLWIGDCVSNLPPDKIFEIAKKVERDYYSGE